MKKKSCHLFFLMLVFICYSLAPSVYAGETGWTEKKLGKVSVRATNAAAKKNWPRAIKYGEQMLEASTVLDRPGDARYINFLKNLNRYYDKAGRLIEVGSRVKKGYSLAKEYLGLTHSTTMMSRTLYYKFVISQKDYYSAILLVLENIDIAEKNTNESYKLLHYLKQLYSLYGVTGQLELEEKTILKYLTKNEQIYGTYDDDKNYTKTIWVLAQNYCRQRKLDKFKDIIIKHKLQFKCILPKP
ncbi:hypothetical protein [Paremcibacter congregatus]|uniref:hypothetical protein n=1 Tax=Paremcibacter congregatus TaxID=2043170 RepID=UPI0010545BF0|nr:hypothetical protein [Paremcibacter congregatus]QDE26256.1 hypothetical protein FIV45_02665 [Paremcibacter congregatus]